MQSKKYAKNLRKLRGKVSRQVVATAIGVTRSAIAMYEQGQRVPKDDIKVKLARYYNTTVEAIFYTSRVNNKLTNKEEQMENIRTALKKLGYNGNAHITEIAPCRYLVSMGGQYFGIWDSERKTFVD